MSWSVVVHEQQDAAGTVTAQGGGLDIVQRSGATVGFKQKLSGDYEIRFAAVPAACRRSG